LAKLVERICAAECEPDEEVTVSPAVLELFRNHPWPGNIRQLHAVLRTAIAMVDDDRVIGERHLCPEFLEDLKVNVNDASSPSADRSLDEIETDIIRKAVDDSHGNISMAASNLGISRTTIYRRLRSP
jgi:transcriptional regulator of acetoin/glycerol metabolism